MPAKKNPIDMSAVEKALPDYFTIGGKDGGSGKIHTACCTAVLTCYRVQRGEYKSNFANLVATKAAKPAAGSSDLCGSCVKLDGKN